MRGVRRKLTFSGLLLLALAGCAEVPPPVRLDAAGVQPEVDYADLAAVLDRGVDQRGYLDMYFLRRLTGRLDAQLRRLAVTGPTASPHLLPTPADRLAYWYNARAAWAVKLAVLANCPRELSREWYEARPFPLDGRQMTLEQIDDILAADEDWRLVVAAPCARLHRAAMPRQPFSPSDLRAGLADRLQRYVDSEDRFVIDVQERRILVPGALWRQRDRLMGHYNSAYHTEGATLVTALLPWVGGSAERRLQNAIGYRAVLDPPGGAMACQRHYQTAPPEPTGPPVPSTSAASQPGTQPSTAAAP